MMKKIFKFAVVLGVLFLITAGVLIWNINPILAKLKPKLTEKISSIVQQPVTIGDINLAFFPNVAVKLENVFLSAESNKTGVETLKLSTPLMGLLRGQVSVSDLSIDGFTASVVRSKEGDIIVGGLNLSKKDKKGDGGNTIDVKKASPPQASATGEKTSLAFEVQSIRVENGSVSFQDFAAKGAPTISIDDIDVAVNNISPTSKADFTIAASVLGTTKENLSIKGSGNLLDLKNTVPPMEAKISLSRVDLKKVVSLASAYGTNLSKMGLQADETLTFTTDVTVSPEGKIQVSSNLDGNPAILAFKELLDKKQGLPLSLTVNASPTLKGSAEVGLISLLFGGISAEGVASVASPKDISATFKSIQVKLGELKNFLPVVKNFNLGGVIEGKAAAKLRGSVPNIDTSFALNSVEATIVNPNGKGAPKVVKNISGDFFAKGSPENLNFGSKQIKIFDGAVSLNGAYQKQAVDAVANTSIEGKNFNLGLISEFILAGNPISLKGTLNEFTTNNRVNIQKPVQSLRGNTSIHATNGSIEGFNFVAKTLGKIGSIPGIGSALLAYIPEKYSQLLNENATGFDDFTMKVSTGEAKARISTMNLRHQLYIISGTGEADFAGSMKMRTQLLLTPLLTQEMVLKEPKIKLLQDREGNIEIPVVLTSENGSFRVLPDASRLFKNAARNTAKEAATRAVEKAVPELKGVGKVLDSLF